MGYGRTKDRTILFEIFVLIRRIFWFDEYFNVLTELFLRYEGMTGV